jgi:hypothetical protein
LSIQINIFWHYKLLFGLHAVLRFCNYTYNIFSLPDFGNFQRVNHEFGLKWREAGGLFSWAFPLRLPRGIGPWGMSRLIIEEGGPLFPLPVGPAAGGKEGGNPGNGGRSSTWRRESIGG